jgi:hypothetical protein
MTRVRLDFNRTETAFLTTDVEAAAEKASVFHALKIVAASNAP